MTCAAFASLRAARRPGRHLRFAADAWSLVPLAPPQGFGAMAVIATGHARHHHADADPMWRHSRDSTGTLTSLLHFDHGFHTVHHVDAGRHWSEWRAAHALLRDRLDPRLDEPSLPWHPLRIHVLALAWPASGSRETARPPRASGI